MRLVAILDVVEGLRRALRALNLGDALSRILDIGRLVPIGFTGPRGSGRQAAGGECGHRDRAGRVRAPASPPAPRRAGTSFDLAVQPHTHTSTLPSLPIARSTSSSLISSPSSISLCALPDGIIGKQLASAATRQSKNTGPLVSII